jgi:hypothetical protein
VDGLLKHVRDGQALRGHCDEELRRDVLQDLFEVWSSLEAVDLHFVQDVGQGFDILVMDFFGHFLQEAEPEAKFGSDGCSRGYMELILLDQRQ